MILSRVATILAGLVMIFFIAPLSQFLAIKTLNMDLETGSPVGWALGVIFALMIGVLLVRLIARTGKVSRPNVVLLYCMLTIAAPVMNIGLVRPIFMGMFVPTQEYMHQGTSTYRTVYESKSESWYPIVPTMGGTAWHKANRLLAQLEDSKAVRERSKAADTIATKVTTVAGQLRRRNETDVQPPAADQSQWTDDQKEVAKLLPKLTVEGAEQLLRVMERDEAYTEAALVHLGLTEEVLLARRAAAEQASDEAMVRLREFLPLFHEDEVSQTSEKMEAMRETKLFDVRRIQADRARRGEAALRNLQGRIELLETPVGQIIDGRVSRDEPLPAAVAELPIFPEVRKLVEAHYGDPSQRDKTLLQLLRNDLTAIAESDRRILRNELRDRYLVRFREMGEEEFHDVWGSLIYRMTKEERRDVLTGTATGAATDRPNENVYGFMKSLWTGLEGQSARKRASWRERLQKVYEETPWNIWIRPLISWSVLVTVIFLIMMALAEWLRRKWIDRENLAFPLVDVADHVIRPDCALETSEDPLNPDRRATMINPVFVVGLLLGAGWLLIEALQHYDFIQPAVYSTSYNISHEWFKEGAIKRMDKVFFVLSPIVIGIAFLVSLEITFSVWVMFILLQLVILITRNKVAEEALRDPVYTGWAAGREFPFMLEQFLGACLCMAAIVMYKSIRARTQAVSDKACGAYITPKLNIVLLIVLPIVLVLLLYHVGLTDVPFTLLLLVVVLGQTIALARARAETGLPTQHISYEFTKFPIVFGLPSGSETWYGMTIGKKAFTVFASLAFLPMTLLFRTLPQQLENLELARRHRLRFGWVAGGSLAAFLVAIGVGMLFYLAAGYFAGEDFWAISGGVYTDQGNQPPYSFAAYGMWVAHFLGEPGLDKWTQIHWIRVWAIFAGIAVFGLLTFLRGRFLKFPLHPMGYFLLLVGIYYQWHSPYYKHDTTVGNEGNLIWASVFVAWLCKKLIIKYGGMNTYKKAKPLFIGMVVGAVMCYFTFNMIDLVASIIAANSEETGTFLKHFLDKTPYSPKVY